VDGRVCLVTWCACAYINGMHGSRSKFPSKKSCPYIYDIKFLALLGAAYIYGINRLRVNMLKKN
jgi:hypothetical protein